MSFDKFSSYLTHEADDYMLTVVLPALDYFCVCVCVLTTLSEANGELSARLPILAHPRSSVQSGQRGRSQSGGIRQRQC